MCATARGQTEPGRPLPPPCDGGSTRSAEGRCPSSKPRKVVLFSGYPTLERFLRKALVPWRMLIELSDREPPGASMPRSSLRSRELSAELGADALVWISTGPDGSALWVEDAQTANLTTRAIADPPFGEPFAAALALSVKTILASSGFAPPESDEAASDTQAAAEEPATQSSDELARVRRAQTVGVDGTAAAPQPLVPRASEPAPPAPEPAARAQLLVFGGARFGAFRPAETEARYGLELRWFPWATSESWPRLLWGAGSVETSTPWSFSRSNFRGQYWELAPALALGMAGTATGGLHLGGSVQFALHWVSISGTRLDDGAKVEEYKYSPAIAARPEVGWRLGSTTLLLQPAFGYFSRRQLYVQSRSPILRTRPIWWMLGGAFALQWR